MGIAEKVKYTSQSVAGIGATMMALDEQMAALR